MKRILKAMLVVGALFSCMASGAWAYPVATGDKIFVSDGIGTVNGGEFGISTTLGGTAIFRTFCLEKDEFIDYTNDFTVSSISKIAERGGNNTNSGDELSTETQWLYWNYIKGTLDDKVTTYKYNNVASANALQNLIWHLEEEIKIDVYGNDPNVNGDDPIITALQTYYDTFGSKEAFGDVEVMNLMDGMDGTAYKQSLLIADPDSTPVPEPGTMVLLGAGMLGLAVFGKRRMNREA